MIAKFLCGNEREPKAQLCVDAKKMYQIIRFINVKITELLFDFARVFLLLSFFYFGIFHEITTLIIYFDVSAA